MMVYFMHWVGLTDQQRKCPTCIGKWIHANTYKYKNTHGHHLCCFFRCWLIWECFVRWKKFNVFRAGLSVASGGKSQDDHEAARHKCYATDDGECFVVVSSYIENPTCTEHNIACIKNTFLHFFTLYLVILCSVYQIWISHLDAVYY